VSTPTTTLPNYGNAFAYCRTYSTDDVESTFTLSELSSRFLLQAQNCGLSTEFGGAIYIKSTTEANPSGVPGVAAKHLLLPVRFFFLSYHDAYLSALYICLPWK
jgi:hypothetical protein